MANTLSQSEQGQIKSHPGDPLEAFAVMRAYLDARAAGSSPDEAEGVARRLRQEIRALRGEA